MSMKMTAEDGMLCVLNGRLGEAGRLENDTEQVQLLEARFGFLNRESESGPGLLVHSEGDAAPTLFEIAELVDLDISVRLADPETGLEDICVDPLTVGGWETLRRIATTGGPDAQTASQWVEHLNALHAEIEQRLSQDGHDVPSALACTILCRQISERVGEVELPDGLDYDAICRYAVHRDLRQQLARLNGDTADQDTTQLCDLLGPAAEHLAAAPGSKFRQSALASARDDSPADRRLMARTNDALVRRLFAPLTRLPPEEITVGIASTAHAEVLGAALESAAADSTGRGRLDPGHDSWLTAVDAELRHTLHDVFGQTYRPRMDFWEIGDSDLLLVEDDFNVCIYSWPTSERQILFEADGRSAVPMVDRARCPDQQELVDLHRQVTERVHELRDEAESRDEAELPIRPGSDREGPSGPSPN